MAVILQQKTLKSLEIIRWGIFAMERGANAKVGSKRKGGENAKMAVRTQRYYSSEKLTEVTKHRGYYTAKAVAQILSQNTGLSVSTWVSKISTGHFSREEMVYVAAYFEMTPKEFCDVFLHGLFNEDSLGHFVAHIKSKEEILPMKHQRSRKDMLDQIDAL